MFRYLSGSTLGACLVLLLLGCTSDDTNAPKPKKTELKKSRPHFVVLATVQNRTLNSFSTHTGSLRYRTAVRIFNQEEGRLLTFPHYEGDKVPAGTKLFEFDTALLDAELKKASAVLRETEVNFNRMERLRGRRVASEEELLRAKTSAEVAKAERDVLRTRRSYAQVTAPFDALVTARFAEPGDVVARQTHLMTLADPTSLIADLQASERVIPHVRVGAQVDVRIDALGSERYRGKVLRIHPELNSRTRQGRVEVSLTPVPPEARSGLFVRVTFELRALERQVMPFAALRRDRQGEYVYRIDRGRAQRTSIQSGRRVGNQVEILDGLSVGEQVITKGFLGLKDGKKVTPIASKQPTA